MAARIRVLVSAFAAGSILLVACTSVRTGAPSPRPSPRTSARPGSVEALVPSHLRPDASVVAVDRRMFVASEFGVSVYRLPCFEARCRPLGRLLVPDPLIAGYPRPGREQPANSFRVGLAGGTLFVVAEVDLGQGSGIRAGRVLAYDPGCELPCGPMWWTPPDRGIELPAIHGGRVFVGSSTGLAAYERCPRDGSLCPTAWTAPLNTRKGLMRTLTPVVHGRYVLALTEGCICGADGDAPMLAAFPVRCEGTCRPLWSARLPGRFAAGPVARGGAVYAAAAGGVFRFPLACSASCRPNARFVLPARAFPRTPVLVPRFLLASTYAPSRVFAFPEACAGRCEPIATWSAPSGLRTVVEVEGGLLALSGRSVSLLAPPPPQGAWGPQVTWDLPPGAETVTVRDGVALVTGEGWLRALRLP